MVFPTVKQIFERYKAQSRSIVHFWPHRFVGGRE